MFWSQFTSFMKHKALYYTYFQTLEPKPQNRKVLRK